MNDLVIASVISAVLGALAGGLISFLISRQQMSVIRLQLKAALEQEKATERRFKMAYRRSVIQRPLRAASRLLTLPIPDLDGVASETDRRHALYAFSDTLAQYEVAWNNELQRFGALIPGSPVHQLSDIIAHYIRALNSFVAGRTPRATALEMQSRATADAQAVIFKIVSQVDDRQV
jgi:hypothetical protein